MHPVATGGSSFRGALCWGPPITRITSADSAVESFPGAVDTTGVFGRARGKKHKKRGEEPAVFDQSLRISLMVNQRFWGRECRQVLGHLQPPQMSVEERSVQPKELVACWVPCFLARAVTSGGFHEMWRGCESMTSKHKQILSACAQRGGALMS